MAKRGEAWFDDDGRPICGARTSRRAGRPCRRSPAKGRLRCRLHGGNAPGAPRGNAFAVKHGYFSAVLTPDEERRAAHIRRGDLADLIVLEYTLLHRAVVAMMRAEEDPEAALVPGEVVMDERPGEAGAPRARAVRTVTRRLPDWHARVGRHVRRIKDLEMAQKALTGTGRSPEEIGQAIRDTLAAAAAYTGPGLPGQDARDRGGGPGAGGGDEDA